MTSIDFYFDFVSPYAYIASTAIEQLAARHDCVVRWRPFRVGVTVTKVMGLRPVMETPLKAEYVRSDVARLAKVFGVPLTEDIDVFYPVNAHRVFHGAPSSAAPRLAKILLSARWAEGKDLENIDILISLACSAGIDRRTVEMAIEDPRTKFDVHEATRQATDRGVFGSPTCVVAEELFWGVDRLWMLENFLKSDHRYQRLHPPTSRALGML
ncbi:2-hydroxychromene-2-carboxylate isomerase [Caballeronia sp. LjRoot34]|uniref:2-hydroxychromene-2-carboxylate isomerase n=1 Tax=Caballeronia sp. LjRoot34 TaxID=3342325 RepID=UPI003ED03763